MKFSINATDFRDVLKAACEVAPSKGILPEQSCLYLNAQNDSLRICARGEETDIELVTSCDVQEEGDTLAPSRMLLDYVSLSEGSVTVSVDAKQRMTIKSGKKASSLACMDTSRFKPMVFPETSLFSVSGSALSAAIARTSFCTSIDETRKEICGVHLSISPDGNIVFVGMDGFKISECELSGVRVMDETDIPHEFTIPNFALKLIVSLFGGVDSVVVNANEYRACVHGDNKTLAFPLCVKRYPQYRTLFPKSYKTEMCIAARPLLDALRLVEVAASSVSANDGRWGIIKLEVDGENGCIHLSADAEMSSAETFVDCDIHGADMTIFYNVRYLRDIATACAKENDEIEFCLTSSESIACMKPLDSAASMRTYIVPVRHR